MRKILRYGTLFLIFALLLPLLASGVLAADPAEVTRAAWISQLVDTFSMTVDDTTAMPDNYYSDLTEDMPCYEDILLAVEFGVIDLDACCCNGRAPRHQVHSYRYEQSIFR